MNSNKMYNRQRARNVLTSKGITWHTFNNDTHWKIGTIDFWPTTNKWIDNKNGLLKEGLEELVNHIIVPYKQEPKQLSVQQIAKIFTKNQDKSLMEKCELLHKEIYQ